MYYLSREDTSHAIKSWSYELLFLKKFTRIGKENKWETKLILQIYIPI